MLTFVSSKYRKMTFLFVQDLQIINGIVCYQCTDCPEPFTSNYPYVTLTNNTNFLAQCTVSIFCRSSFRHFLHFPLENSVKFRRRPSSHIKRFGFLLSKSYHFRRDTNDLLRHGLLQCKYSSIFIFICVIFYSDKFISMHYTKLKTIN